MAQLVPGWPRRTQETLGWLKIAQDAKIRPNWLRVLFFVLAPCVVVRAGSVCCFSCWLRVLWFVLPPCVVCRVGSVCCFSRWLRVVCENIIYEFPPPVQSKPIRPTPRKTT